MASIVSDSLNEPRKFISLSLSFILIFGGRERERGKREKRGERERVFPDQRKVTVAMNILSMV